MRGRLWRARSSPSACGDRRTQEPSVRRCGGTESQALNRSAFGRGEGSGTQPIHSLTRPDRSDGKDKPSWPSRISAFTDPIAHQWNSARPPGGGEKPRSPRAIIASRPPYRSSCSACRFFARASTSSGESRARSFCFPALGHAAPAALDVATVVPDFGPHRRATR